MWGGSFIWLFPSFDLRHVAAASAYREDCAQSARHKFESAALAWKIRFSPEIIVIQKKSYSPKRPLFFCCFFSAFWRMMHSDPLSPSFKKYMDCNDKCMNHHDSGKIMCVNMCQPHGIKFFLPRPLLGRRWRSTPGFQQARAPSPWCFRPKHPQNERVLLSICIVWTAPKLRGLAIDYCLTCEIESSHNLPKVKTSRQFQRFFWAQVRSLEKRSIFHVLIPNQSGFPMLQHATNVVVLEVANLDPAWGV